MTGKRFEYKNHKVFDNLTGEEHSSNMVSVNVLNQLAEENEQLKHDATVLICSNQEYRKENEQLKTKNNAYLQDIEMFKEENTTLKLENQELHRLNQEYINSLSDEKKETLSEMLNAILGDDGE